MCVKDAGTLSALERNRTEEAERHISAQSSDLTGIQTPRSGAELRKDAAGHRGGFSQEGTLNCETRFYHTSPFSHSHATSDLCLKHLSEAERTCFNSTPELSVGLVSLRGFSARSRRLQWTLPRGSALLPPVTRNPAAVVHAPRVCVWWIYERIHRDSSTDCFGTGCSGTTNEEFNIHSHRPGKRVIPPLVTEISAGTDRERRWVNSPPTAAEFWYHSSSLGSAVGPTHIKLI